MNPTRTLRRRNTRSARRLSIALVALSLAGVACGSDNAIERSAQAASETTEHVHETRDTAEDTPATPATTDAPDPRGDDPTTTVAQGGAPSADGVIDGIDAAQSGSIQILATGALRDPEVGTYAGTGSGSGFFIDANGLAVTNNHVVTGAATLEVFVGGDTDESYNARVLGVSECNDLAVIQVEVPGSVPYFQWHDGDTQPGLDVYAAGFPLGDPQFTLTRGIVSKAEADGDVTGTSSVAHTIEHDAAIHPGNSGGPLLASDGSVVAVNYAGGLRDLGSQYYAISSDIAAGVVERLASGDFESIGVNGHAVADEATGIVGIWVSGVAPGSPAGEIGVKPGDIITRMNGLPVGTDGTFADYCDIIRTAGDRPISVEVLRFDTQEVLEGEINGNKPLTPTFSFGQEVMEETASEAPIEEGAGYTEYVQVTDDSGTLSIEVPAEWAEVDTAPADGGESGPLPQILASTDLDTFVNSFGAPGVQFAALPAAAVTVDDLLASFAQPDACTDGGVSDYDDGAFVGKYQVWEDCGDTGSLYVVLATTTAAGSHTFLTAVQAVSSADLDALDHILGTFNAAG